MTEPFQVPAVIVPKVVIAVEPDHDPNAVEISTRAIVLNEGAPAAPEGAAKNVF
jgi:hypothetical protein